MDFFEKSNREYWNRLVPLHAASSYYDLEAFKLGASSLYPIEEAELTDVRDKCLLHLQCHFGLDTMSWARKGAIATGVDFSDEAIKLARELNQELNLSCQFIESSIYTLDEQLSGKFDIVFTSYGVLAWLSDLKAWAKTIGQFLKPGGIFYMVEIHPFTNILDDSEMKPPQVRVGYPYFFNAEPMLFENEESYAGGKLAAKERQFEWQHSFSDILNALTEAGLEIEFVHEFDFTTFKQVNYLEQKGRLFYMPEKLPKIPLLFSLQARLK